MSILTSTSTLTSTFYQLTSIRCDVWWKMHQAVPRPAAAMKYHIHIHIFIAGCAQNSWGEAMSDSGTLFFVKKKPRGRVPLKWLSYEIALQIHCCRYISFPYVYWFFCKIFGDLQHKVDWIQQISINTHNFFTLMFFTTGTHLTDLPPVWKISYLSATFLWEIVLTWLAKSTASNQSDVNILSTNQCEMRCMVEDASDGTQPPAAMKYHIYIHIFIASCEQKGWGEAMSDSSTLFFCEKTKE